MNSSGEIQIDIKRNFHVFAGFVYNSFSRLSFLGLDEGVLGFWEVLVITTRTISEVGTKFIIDT